MRNYKTLKGFVNGEVTKKEARIIFADNPRAEGVTEVTISNLIKSAEEYVIKIEEEESFSIVLKDPVSLLISGKVIYKDQEEMEILVTRITRNIYFSSDAYEIELVNRRD